MENESFVDTGIVYTDAPANQEVNHKIGKKVFKGSKIYPSIASFTSDNPQIRLSSQAVYYRFKNGIEPSKYLRKGHLGTLIQVRGVTYDSCSAACFENRIAYCVFVYQCKVNPQYSKGAVLESLVSLRRLLYGTSSKMLVEIPYCCINGVVFRTVSDVADLLKVCAKTISTSNVKHGLVSTLIRYSDDNLPLHQVVDCRKYFKGLLAHSME